MALLKCPQSCRVRFALKFLCHGSVACGATNVNSVFGLLATPRWHEINLFIAVENIDIPIFKNMMVKRMPQVGKWLSCCWTKHPIDSLRISGGSIPWLEIYPISLRCKEEGLQFYFRQQATSAQSGVQVIIRTRLSTLSDDARRPARMRLPVTILKSLSLGWVLLSRLQVVDAQIVPRETTATTSSTSYPPLTTGFTPAPECSSLTIMHFMRIAAYVYQGCIGSDQSCCPQSG